jgi:outer membrane protein
MVKAAGFLLLTLGVALMPLGAGAADVKIGIVDSSDIMAKSSEAKRVQENLKRRGDELSKDLQRQEQELGRIVEDFRKQSGVMKEDARKQKEADINKRAGEFQRKVQDADKQLAQLEQKEMEPILKKLEQAVNAVAQDSKLDVVFDKRRSGLLFMAPALDITEKVRTRFGK